MGFIVASSTAELLDIVRRRLQELVDPKDLDALALFSSEFFGIAPFEELLARQQDDLAGCLLSAWRLLQQFDNSAPTLPAPGRFGERVLDPFFRFKSCANTVHSERGPASHNGDRRSETTR